MLAAVARPTACQAESEHSAAPWNGRDAQRRVTSGVEDHQAWPTAATPPRTWGSVASKALVCVSHSAAARMSASRMQPLLLLNAKTLQCDGWKSAAVMTCGQVKGPQA